MRQCEGSWPLSIFVPHGATELTDHESNGDGLVQWALIRELALRGHRLTVVAPAVSLHCEVPAGVEIHEVRGGRSMSLPQYVARAYNIYRKSRRTRHFDLIHQMNPVVRGVTLPWALSRSRIVLGTYVGDWPYEVPTHRMRSANPLLWSTMAIKVALDVAQQLFARQIIVATPFAKNRMPLLRLVADRVTEIPHGIDVDRYSREVEVGDPLPRAHSVLLLGLVTPHKGVTVMLDAFDLVHKELPHARLVVVGAGSLDRVVVQHARHRGWESQLELVGPIKHESVGGWLRACSVVCSAALGEPFGQAIVEALACGRPVIVNDCGGPRYVVAGTGNPVVPMGNPKALARAIVDLLTDPARCAHLGQENRTLAERRFAWSRVVDRLEEAYRVALGRKESSP